MSGLFHTRQRRERAKARAKSIDSYLKMNVVLKTDAELQQIDDVLVAAVQSAVRRAFAEEKKTAGVSYKTLQERLTAAFLEGYWRVPPSTGTSSRDAVAGAQSYVNRTMNSLAAQDLSDALTERAKRDRQRSMKDPPKSSAYTSGGMRIGDDELHRAIQNAYLQGMCNRLPAHSMAANDAADVYARNVVKVFTATAERCPDSND